MKSMLIKEWGLRALKEGDKTMTRRLHGLDALNKEPDLWEFGGINKYGQYIFYPNEHGEEKYPEGYPDYFNGIIQPRYLEGELFYFKELWLVHKKYDHLRPTDLPDKERLQQGVVFLSDINEEYKPDWMGKNRSPLHLPQNLARFFSQIMGIGIQRVRDISENDAKLEGVKTLVDSNDPTPIKYREAFKRIWLDINGADSWEHDWTWIYLIKEVKI